MQLRGAYLGLWDGREWFDTLELFEAPATELRVITATAIVSPLEMYAAGAFDRVGGQSIARIARWDGAQWGPLGAGLSVPPDARGVRTLESLSGGGVLVGGQFEVPDLGNVRTALARWSNNTWSLLGGPVDGVVNTIVELSDGRVLIGGRFTNVGGVAALNVALWDGQSWSSLGPGLNADVLAAEVLPTGEFVFAGTFRAAGDIESQELAVWSPSGAPRIATQPVARTVASGATVNLSVLPAYGISGVTVRWLRNNIPISDGVGGASTGGGNVVNATRTYEVITTDAAAIMNIIGARHSDSGIYVAEVSNACGTVRTRPVVVSVGAVVPCDLLDFNNDGVLPDPHDLADFVRVLGGGDCPTCNDVDFNNDGVFPDDADLAAYVRVMGGGSC